MPLDNLISVSLTPAQLTALDDALTVIEGIINPIAVALSPEENQLYGKLGNETENFAKMVHDDTKVKADLVPVQVDTGEWERDVAARAVIMPRLTRLTDLTTKLEQTNRLLGYDVNNAVSATYGYVRYMAEQNVPGFSTYYDKWKVQHVRKGRPGKGGSNPS